MSEYRLLLKRDLWTIKNHIQEIRNNPKRLILYGLQLAWIIYMVFVAMQSSKRPSTLRETIGPQIVEAGYTLLILGLWFYSLDRGTKESSTFFSLGDVHLLFPAPVSSRKVLLYHMLRQSIFNFFLYGIMPLVFIPSLVNLTNIDLGYLGYLYLGYISLVLLMEPTNFLMFSLGTKYQIESKLRVLVYSMMGLAVMYVVGTILYTKDLLNGLFTSVNASFINYIPVIGWSKTIFMTSITGYSRYSDIASILQLLLLAITIFLCYYTADNYYEDVLGATEKKTLRRKQKKGMEKAEKLSFFSNKKVRVKKMGTGPWAFIWRAKVEYERTDLHAYISIITFVFIGIALIVGYLNRQHIGTLTPMYIANGMIAYMIFIFSASQAGHHELTKPYIFLTPGNSMQKIVATNLIGVIRMSINAILLNIILGMMLKVSITYMILLSIFLISFYLLNLSSNFVARVLFPDAIDQRVIFTLLLMLQIVLLLLPGLIVGGICALIFKNALAFFIGITVVNMGIMGALLILGDTIFQRLEWR